MKVIIIKCVKIYINRKIPFQTYLTIIKNKKRLFVFINFNYPERIVSVIKSDFIQTVMREFQQLRLRLILMFKKLDQKTYSEDKKILKIITEKLIIINYLF
jgi:hypothetical protein